MILNLTDKKTLLDVEVLQDSAMLESSGSLTDYFVNTKGNEGGALATGNAMKF